MLLTYNQAVAAVSLLVARLRGLDIDEWIRRDDGLDDSPSKMIWIAAAIVIAGLAVAFAIQIFGQARDNVPDPVVPGG